jgi:hypothetical protein
MAAIPEDFFIDSGLLFIDVGLSSGAIGIRVMFPIEKRCWMTVVPLGGHPVLDYDGEFLEYGTQKTRLARGKARIVTT